MGTFVLLNIHFVIYSLNDETKDSKVSFVIHGFLGWESWNYSRGVYAFSERILH